MKKIHNTGTNFYTSDRQVQEIHKLKQNIYKDLLVVLLLMKHVESKMVESMVTSMINEHGKLILNVVITSKPNS